MLLCVYFHDKSSKYFNPNIYEEISEDILEMCGEDTPLIMKGDLNSRVGNIDDRYMDTDLGGSCHIGIGRDLGTIPERKNSDRNEPNEQGMKLIDLCKTLDLTILNGRPIGDPYGNITFYDENIGKSTIDYSICNRSFFKNIKNFMVLPQNELSDHCKIVTELEENMIQHDTPKDEYNWTNPEHNFKNNWNEELKHEFSNYLMQSN